MPQTTSAPIGLTAIRPGIENTRALRLSIALSGYRCPHCTASWPLVYKTQGRVRYVKCRRCGITGKVVVS